MPHYGTLAQHRFIEDVNDLRGTPLYGLDDVMLGNVDDVVFDHDTGEIRYVVVDSGGWLKSNKFVVPSPQIHSYIKREDALQADLTKEQVQSFPAYKAESVGSQQHWPDYETRYQQNWKDNVVQHKEGSTRNVTPEPNEVVVGRGSLGEDVTQEVAPKVIQHGESAPVPPPEGIGSLGEEVVPITEPAASPNRGPRWDRFEELLRKNRVDITAKCPSCAPAKDRAA
jgi:hypothetical protein